MVDLPESFLPIRAVMSSKSIDVSLLSDHPNPAIYDHLKTGHMETHSGTLTTA